nr:16S rRNA (cytosine(1402)-N(4))-methyltransferase [Elusimicrobiota bacterium]
EDREVKRTFRKYAGQCSCPPNFPICRCGAKDIRPRVKILKESGLRPSKKEVENNPSSRSAHLRVCQIEETNE